MITKKDWNDLLDKYMITGVIDDITIYSQLDEYQLYAINEIKKSIERIKNQ